jgi:phage terminase large subunit-like protein
MSLAGLEINPEALAALPEADRAAVVEQLGWLEEAAKDNPLLVYGPHEKQAEFHRQPFRPLRAFFGGNRSGKTTAAMVDTIIQAVDRDALPAHLLPFKRWEPPFKCRVMTPDFGDTHEVVLEKIRKWCPRGQLKGGSFQHAFDKQRRVLWFKNGSRIHFNSNVQDREQLGGSDLHRVLYDEEPRRDLRTESLTRLIDHDGEEVFAMTPLEGMSWLYDEIYEPWELAVAEADGEATAAVEERLGMRVLVVDMDDNPHLSEPGKARALAAYSGEEREARKSGRFVSFAGLIYPQFRTSRHVVPDVKRVPDGVECFEGLDPGMRIMAAVLFCYLDSDDRLVVYDELALQGKTVAVVAEEMKRKRVEWGVTPRWTIIDPAARNKSAQTGRSDQQEYADHGIFTIPGQNEIRPGINRVRERLDADRLLIAARCSELRSEFKKYRWKKDSTRTEDSPRESPVKKDDHLLDALRYVVMQRPLAPERDRPKMTDTYKDRLLRHSLKRLTQLGGRRSVDTGFGPGQWS